VVLSASGASRRGRRLAWALALVPLWFAASYGAAYRLTRRAEAPYAEPLPAVGWAPLEAVRLRARDGEELGAWFAPGEAGRPAVVLLHGNGLGRRSRLGQAEWLSRAGYAVLLPTLRAHGDSTGAENDFGHGARLDVVAAVEWLEARRPGGRVAIWGASLGAAAALFAARELGARASGYVLECPYRDLRTALRHRAAIYLPPGLDALASFSLEAAAPLALPDFERVAPEHAAAAARGLKALVLAGGADARAWPDEARAIAEALGPGARLSVFEGAGHLGLAEADSGRYEREVLAFLGGL
jgi:dipeptidyl aminopeptidase/acylaminoacyl peptidase